MKIAVLIPCYNEEKTIGKVISDFKRELPDAQVLVFDNNSRDNSVAIAQESGARVIKVRRQGKGFVVRRMFEEAQADICVMVDGDDTYFAKDVHKLIKPVMDDDTDMTIGRRILVSDSAMKKINWLGNVLFSNLLNFVFMRNIRDVLSGYRVMNRELINSVPILAYEFQVEMEITIQALYRNLRLLEIPVDYKERPHGSFSKLHPLKDGALIFITLLALIRDLMPLMLFGVLSVVLFSIVLGYGLYVYYLPRMATLLDTVVIVSLAIIAFLFLVIGLFLHTVNRRFFELICIIKKNSGRSS
jgi:glycosyltransferase involved in cell wall biosynthesis